MYQAIFGFYFGDGDYDGSQAVEFDTLKEVEEAAKVYHAIVEIKRKNHNGFCQFIYERGKVPEDVMNGMIALGYDPNFDPDADFDDNEDEDKEYYDGPMDKFSRDKMGFSWPYKEGEFASPSGGQINVIEIKSKFQL